MDKDKIAAARELFYMNTSIQILDNTTVITEQYTRLLEINELLVRLITGNLLLSVWGNSLSVTDLKAGGVRITGTITSLELLPRKGGC
ncbi:MAG: YabP/YqfC family sporulation protein [Ruminococcus sp.]|nr:YabP/YqfC family sporulation protein [Ruminococcus sp.]